MRITAEEKAPSGKIRVLLAIGDEEIKILGGLLSRALEVMPRNMSPEIDSFRARMSNMDKVFKIYLGQKRPEQPNRMKSVQCPKCERKTRGEKALEMHLLRVHSK